MNKEEFFELILKKFQSKRPDELLSFIRNNFNFLFENVDILLKLEKEIENYESKFKIKDPVFKLLKARLFSLKHEHQLVEKEFKELDFDKLPVEFHDFYYYTAALIYFNKKNFNLALKLIESGLELTEKSKRKLSNYMDYRLKNLKGIIHFGKDDYDSALSSFKEALVSAEKVKISKIGYRGIMESIGKVYMIKGDFPEAIDMFEKILRDLKEESLDYRILRKMAVCYLNMGDVEKAIEYINKAVENFELQKGVEYYQIFLYITLSDIFIAAGDMKKAGEYIDLLRKVSAEYSFINIKFNAMLSEVKFMIINRNIENAFYLLSEFKEPDSNSLLAEFLLYRAIILFYLSELKNSRFYFENALSVVPSDVFLRDVIWNTYVIFLSKLGETENGFFRKSERKIFSSLFSSVNLKKESLEVYDVIKKVGRVI